MHHCFLPHCLHNFFFSGEDFAAWYREDRSVNGQVQNKEKGRTYRHDLFKGNFSGDKRALAIRYVTSVKSRPSLEAHYGKAFMLFIVMETKQEMTQDRRRNSSKWGNSLKGTMATKKFKDANTDNMTRNAYMKPCPSCKTPIEKNGGCKFMSCMWCNVTFCWKCFSKQASCDCKYYDI